MKKVTRLELMPVLAKAIRRGLIFRVTFKRRSDGEVRNMVARTGVHRYLKGGGRAYDFEAKGLVSVWDLQSKGYRCLPLEGILEIAAFRQVYEVV